MIGKCIECEREFSKEQLEANHGYCVECFEMTFPYSAIIVGAEQ